jgi:hypothetical protein
MPTGPNSGRAELLAAATDAVARARRLATELGPDSSRAWDFLELAADVERAAWTLENNMAEAGSA